MIEIDFDNSSYTISKNNQNIEEIFNTDISNGGITILGCLKKNQQLLVGIDTEKGNILWELPLDLFNSDFLYFKQGNFGILMFENRVIVVNLKTGLKSIDYHFKNNNGYYYPYKTDNLLFIVEDDATKLSAFDLNVGKLWTNEIKNLIDFQVATSVYIIENNLLVNNDIIYAKSFNNITGFNIKTGRKLSSFDFPNNTRLLCSDDNDLLIYDKLGSIYRYNAFKSDTTKIYKFETKYGDDKVYYARNKTNLILWGNQKLQSLNLKNKKLNWVLSTKENIRPNIKDNQIFSTYGAEISSGGKIGDPIFTEMIDIKKGIVISTTSHPNNLLRYIYFDCSSLKDENYWIFPALENGINFLYGYSNLFEKLVWTYQVPSNSNRKYQINSKIIQTNFPILKKLKSGIIILNENHEFSYYDFNQRQENKIFKMNDEYNIIRFYDIIKK